MRAVIQRVTQASVSIGGQVKSAINEGFLILLGVCDDDTMEDVDWLVHKIAALRVFDDDNHVMNRSIVDIGGNALVVSQFTLYASYTKRAIARRGLRPAAMKSAYPSTRHSVRSWARPSARKSARANLAPICRSACSTTDR